MDFFNTHINKRSIELVNSVLKSTFLSEGEIVKKFEENLCLRLGLVNPVAVNSGTSALHLAIAVEGVKLCDEVILPAQTFVATGLVVLMQGAKPTFADIQYKTGNINPDSIKEKITEKSKAIIPLHYTSYPANLEKIQKTAKNII